MLLTMRDEEMMKLALREAQDVGNEVPVAAAIFDENDSLVCVETNIRESSSDVSGHAEVLALKHAARQFGDWRLEGLTLAVTLEPCVMCAGAIREARLSRVIFGAWDQKIGAGGSAYDILRDTRLGRVPEVIGGVLAKECSEVLGDFFQRRRLD